MFSSIQERLEQLFDSIEIYLEYSPDVKRIDQFTWNGDVHPFRVEYVIDSATYVFQFEEETANKLGMKTDPLEQLEDEVRYIKRMYERGIGSKDYYPFTTIDV
ncbi:hypothetical protein FZW96_16380 [Bacillus sp. BGMRC 2118]|nr:hypothetical protein FZW96_16380 [Bacillus sp. BGMRC 2118]